MGRKGGSARRTNGNDELEEVGSPTRIVFVEAWDTLVRSVKSNQPIIEIMKKIFSE